jgi:hypothetical protein
LVPRLLFAVDGGFNSLRTPSLEKRPPAPAIRLAESRLAPYRNGAAMFSIAFQTKCVYEWRIGNRTIFIFVDFDILDSMP